MTIPMNELRRGQRGEVLTVDTDQNMRRRLLDLGLIPGTHIERIMDSPAGDPICYSVRGAMIALRTADATRIKVFVGDKEEAA